MHPLAIKPDEGGLCAADGLERRVLAGERDGEGSLKRGDAGVEGLGTGERDRQSRACQQQSHLKVRNENDALSQDEPLARHVGELAVRADGRASTRDAR